MSYYYTLLAEGKEILSSAKPELTHVPRDDIFAAQSVVVLKNFANPVLYEMQ